MAKPHSANTTNQASSEDNQNFDIDVLKLKADWINQIDSIRSYGSIITENSKIVSALSKGGVIDITSITKLIKMEQTVQESRCHAFFRWIGFPVVSDGFNIYNPGFDITSKAGNANKTITVQKKINIATHPIDKFEALSVKRENFAKSNLETFSIPSSIDAGTLALSSGGTSNLRKFSVPVSVDNVFDMNSDSQSFTVDLNGLVGEAEISLLSYQDANGSFPKKLSDKRLHIIKPFIVDARIDFSVSPQNKLISVPFITDSLSSKVDPVNFVRRPLLEKIIRDRFAVSTTTDIQLGTATTDILKIIGNFTDIKDDSLIGLATNPNSALQPSEQLELSQTINTIKSMMIKLVDAQDTIKKAQGQYYWLPTPDISGPENGSTVRGIFFPTVIDLSLVTEKDSDIFLSTSSVQTDSINSQGADATGDPDAGSFGLASHTVTFGPDTTDALGDNSTENLKSLSQQRAKSLTEANIALQTIEIIMGDFSGLGLCDIVAIIGALNSIPKENLLAFLDVDALARALDAVPQISGTTVPSYTDAMTQFTSRVKDFYNLMDKIYGDILSNGISS
jgi:hypothetical protein